MTLDGTIYGLVRSDPGGFREADRLLIDGIPFHQEMDPGTVLVTSGLGGVFPRGIPIGKVFAEAESSLGWRRSYWVTPFVFPGDAIHVVTISPISDELDYQKLWGFEINTSDDLDSNRGIAIADSMDLN
jgi:rod shape-determining protein MreC